MEATNQILDDIGEEVQAFGLSIGLDIPECSVHLPALNEIDADEPESRKHR